MFKQQKQIITEFLAKNPKLSSREIATELGLNYNSVRGRISDLKKSKLLFVNDESEYSITQNWFKKILKTGKTTKPRTGRTTENIEVITYEPNEDNEFQRLYDGAIENIDELEYIDEAGYTQNQISTELVENNYVFPAAKLLTGNKTETIQI